MGRPCAVFLDLQLGADSGHEVLAAIRRLARWKTIPVIMLTGSSQTVDVYLSYRQGANAYLVKPADPLELAYIVTQAASFWLRKNLVPGGLTR